MRLHGLSDTQNKECSKLAKCKNKNELSFFFLDIAV